MRFTNRNYYYRKPKRKKKAPGRRKWLYRSIIVLFSLWFIYLFLGGPCGLVKIISLYTKIKKTEGKIDRLTAERIILAKKCKKLSNDLFAIERIAREKLGMIKDGEIVYRILKKK